MSRRLEFIPYRPKQVLNKGKRADHWFWSRYSAYPYIGCQHGCHFCYCRERKYSPYDDPNDFAYQVKVKENAPELLRAALSRLPVDVIFTGDYQAAERKFGLSKRMLEVCLDLGFPVFVLERSPLVTRDLDLIAAIAKKAAAVVAFSILSTPDSPGYERVRVFERLAPAPEKRFAAMRAFARAGVVTGTCLMPVLPGICDSDADLESVVRWTAENGGSFVLTGGLTLSDQQREYYFGVLSGRFPELIDLYNRLYPLGKSYGATGNQRQHLSQRVRELCPKYGLSHRVPRPVIPGEKRALNKRVVEALASQLYDLEIDGGPVNRQWDFRKAAWAVEDMEQNLSLFYDTLGKKGLQNVPGIGPQMAGVVEGLLLNLRGG